MTAITVQGNASGAGTLTVAAPNTASNFTMTLPAATDTFVGKATTDTLTNKTLTSPTMTTPTIDSAQIPTVSGTAPLYMCRAWVNFNGTTAAINASGNVTSVTRTAAGTFTVAFTTAMPDANYAVIGTMSATTYLRVIQTSTFATGSFVVRSVSEASTIVDTTGSITVAVFR